MLKADENLIIGILFGFILGFTVFGIILMFVGCEPQIKPGFETAFEEEVLRRLDKQNEILSDFIREQEIKKDNENIFNEIAQKKYYAFIIDANSPFYRYDRYEVFILDSPNLADYDPNTSDWFLIDSFKWCGSDPNCVRRVMGYRSEEPDNMLYNLHWVWGE